MSVLRVIRIRLDSQDRHYFDLILFDNQQPTRNIGLLSMYPPGKKGKQAQQDNKDRPEYIVNVEFIH